jgi:hypothetical protein
MIFPNTKAVPCTRCLTPTCSVVVVSPYIHRGREGAARIFHFTKASILTFEMHWTQLCEESCGRSEFVFCVNIKTYTPNINLHKSA